MVPADLIGVVLDGRYRIIEPIAQGAMGVVYRAERVKLGRIVAVKVLHELLPTELSSRRRFEIEAKAMAKLEHPHCASVVDVGLHEDRPFVVMDFVSGQNLKDLIAAEAPLPIPRAAEILRQILSGLAHAHEHGIIHRDIKPANLVLSQKAGLGDHVKILDFGLARLSHDSSLTTGIVVGTPSYMAPEQIRGLMIDGRVDVYACGVVLFELLTGTKPFVSERDDPIEVCSLHLKQPAPSLAERRPGVEFGELEAVVARALAKSADHRFASAVDFAAALDVVAPRGALATPLTGVPIVESRASGESASGRTLPMPEPVASAAAPAIPATESGALATEPDVAPPGRLAAASAGRPRIATASPKARGGRRLALAAGGGRFRLAAVIAAVIAVVIVVVLAVRGGGAPAPAPADAGIAGGSSEATGPDPAAETIARASELIADGQKSAALELLLAGRKRYPADARLPYLSGKLYFERFYWTEGLKNFREAIRLAPSYRTDPELIKTVLRGFIVTPRADGALAGFLRDEIGDEARPFLEETAAEHPNPVVRQRAASELRRYR